MQSFDSSLTFSANDNPDVSLRGFWPPEDGFVWSTGKWCEITFAFDVGRKSAASLADLILDMDVFKVPDRLDGQNVMIYLNGLRVGSYMVQRRTTYFASFDAAILRPTDNVLTVDTPDTASPANFGSSDKRLLGIQLFSCQIRRSG